MSPRTGRPKKADPRDKNMLVRVTSDEKKAIEDAAAREGKPAATWLREVGLARTRKRAG